MFGPLWGNPTLAQGWRVAEILKDCRAKGPCGNHSFGQLFNAVSEV